MLAVRYDTILDYLSSSSSGMLKNYPYGKINEEKSFSVASSRFSPAQCNKYVTSTCW